MSKKQATVNRYAHVVEDGTVWGVSLWDGVTDYTPPAGHTLHKLDDDSPVGPGWAFKDGEFVDERPPAEPELDE
jgi:hypothetical protein